MPVLNFGPSRLPFLCILIFLALSLAFYSELLGKLSLSTKGGSGLFWFLLFTTVCIDIFCFLRAVFGEMGIPESVYYYYTQRHITAIDIDQSVVSEDSQSSLLAE